MQRGQAPLPDLFFFEKLRALRDSWKEQVRIQRGQAPLPDLFFFERLGVPKRLSRRNNSGCSGGKPLFLTCSSSKLRALRDSWKEQVRIQRGQAPLPDLFFFERLGALRDSVEGTSQE